MQCGRVVCNAGPHLRGGSSGARYGLPGHPAGADVAKVFRCVAGARVVSLDSVN